MVSVFADPGGSKQRSNREVSRMSLLLLGSEQNRDLPTFPDRERPGFFYLQFFDEMGFVNKISVLLY
jgi:hypothetical protein